MTLLRTMMAAGMALGLSTAAVAATPGEQGYNDNYSACHQPNGLGIQGAFPALKGNKFVLGDPKLVAATVLNGRGGMPAFKPSLTDVELAQILTYVRAGWGNKARPMTPPDFAKARNGPMPPPATRLQAH